MIMFEDLKKLTEKIKDCKILDDTVEFNVNIKLEEWNLKSLDNELFRLTGKNENEHQECSTIQLTISGVNYTLSS